MQQALRTCSRTCRRGRWMSTAVDSVSPTPHRHLLAPDEPDVDYSMAPVPPHPLWVLARRPEYYDPPTLPKTHGIHVATMQFEVYNPDKSQLPLATGFALQAAYHLGIPCARPYATKIQRELQTVLRSGFVHKAAMENFWRLTHRRYIKAYDSNEEVINRWINYLTHHGIATNVRMTTRRVVYRQPGWGKRLEQQQDPSRVRDEKSRQNVAAISEAWTESREEVRKSKTSARPAFSRDPSFQHDDLVDRLTQQMANSGATLGEQIKLLAEELIEKELRPKADAVEALQSTAGAL